MDITREEFIRQQEEDMRLTIWRTEQEERQNRVVESMCFIFSYQCSCGFTCKRPGELWDHIQEHNNDE